MIQIEDVSFSYGKKRVLENISLEIKPGRIYGLLGENGVGKTTLLKLIAGLQYPNSGTCKVNGENSFSRTPSILRRMFYLPENLDFLKTNYRIRYFARENRFFYPNFSMEKLESILEEFNIDPNANFLKLSQGDLKKAYIAYGISTQTEVLLLDEPTNGLDIPSKSVFRKIMLDHFTDDTCAIISTHQVRDLENLIDPIIIIDNQSAILNNTLEEIAEKLSFTLEKTENSEALYFEQTLGGYLTVAQNQTDRETNVNLEALFNATIKNKDLIKELFKK